MFVSLIGANGAGKSTLLKCLMYLLKPKTGSVLIENIDLLNLSEKEIARLRASVLADRIFPFNMRVHEIVSLGRNPHQDLSIKLSKRDQEIILDAVKMLEIESLLERKFVELSDGQKQKVLITRAIVQEPRVLLLDEPATHLDAKSKVEILLKLRKIAKTKNLIVIASMHEIEIAYRISDKIIILENGSITAKDSPEEVFKNGTIQSVYNIQKMAWHPIFGSLELKSTKSQFPKIHVVGGFGTATPVYRLLSRLGHSFSTGVLDKIDVDYCLAETIDAKIFSNSKPYEKITVDSGVLSQLKRVQHVIDTGFPINERTLPNINLIKQLQQTSIFSLRTESECRAVFGINGIRCGNLSDLEEFLHNITV